MILKRYLTDKKVIIPAIIIVVKSINKFEILEYSWMISCLFLIISTKKEPAVTGKNIKNEKWAASSFDNLLTLPPKIVDPLLEIPGKTPTPWKQPIKKASWNFNSFNVFSPFNFLLINKMQPVTIKKENTKYKLE